MNELERLEGLVNSGLFYISDEGRREIVRTIRAADENVWRPYYPLQFLMKHRGFGFSYYLRVWYLESRVEWRSQLSGSPPVSFEKVFEVSPPGLRELLLYNMDLFE
jgi:hypothetical protein